MTHSLVLLPPPADSPAARAAALLAQAREAADAHIAGAVTDMGALARLGDQIAAGGETYPIGVRAEMQRLADHLEQTATRVAMIMERAR